MIHWFNERQELKKAFFILLFFQTTSLFAQTDSVKAIKFSAYGEVYYSYDFANPSNHEKPAFIYNHKRHNELNINLVCAKASYLKNNIRGNLAAMVGNYAYYNLAAEPTWAQFVYEANLGVKLSKRNAIWLDAGIMPSHIGFESAVSTDCWTLTRSIMAENSPYYETGVKLSYTSKKENFTSSFLVLNGWQRIKKPDYIQRPSFGIQLNYRPVEKLVLNYSNFIGTDKPDSLNAIRTFHNFYLQYQPKKRFGVIVGFDIGSDKHNDTDYGIWFSPVAIFRYAITEKVKVALRGEYYADKDQLIITTNTINGFQVGGISTNIDYQIIENVLFRIEGKIYHSKDRYFYNAEFNNYTLTTAMCVKL